MPSIIILAVVYLVILGRVSEAVQFNPKSYADGLPLGSYDDEDEAGNLANEVPLYHTNVLPRPRPIDKKYVLPKWKPHKKGVGSKGRFPSKYKKYFPNIHNSNNHNHGYTGNHNHNNNNNIHHHNNHKHNYHGHRSSHQHNGHGHRHTSSTGSDSSTNNDNNKNNNNAYEDDEDEEEKGGVERGGIETEHVTFADISKHLPPSSAEECSDLCQSVMIKITLPTKRAKFWCATKYPKDSQCMWVLLKVIKRFKEWSDAAIAQSSNKYRPYKGLKEAFQGIRDATCKNMCNPG